MTVQLVRGIAIQEEDVCICCALLFQPRVHLSQVGNWINSNTFARNAPQGLELLYFEVFLSFVISSCFLAVGLPCSQMIPSQERPSTGKLDNHMVLWTAFRRKKLYSWHYNTDLYDKLQLSHEVSDHAKVQSRVSGCWGT